jgi:MFS family permease
MSFTSTRQPSLLRNRDFVLAVAARTASLVGDIAALVALTLRTQPNGAWAVSGLLIAGFLPMVVMTPIAGVLADRVDSRTLLAAAGLAQFGTCLVLAQVDAQAAVLGLVFLLGCGDAITGATWTALLPGIVGDERLGAAIGIRQAAATVAGVAAPALGGLLTGLGGAGLVLNLDAVTFLAVGGAAPLLGHRRGRTPTAATDADGRAGFSVIRRDPVLRGLIGALFVFCLVAGMVNVISVFLIRQTLDASTTWFGVEAAVSSAAMTGGALLFGRVNGLRRLVGVGLVGMAGMSVACIGYGVAPTITWLMIPAALCGFANAALNVSVGTVTMLRTPEAARGRVAAAISGVTSAGLIASMALGGALATVLTPREIFACAGVGTLAIPALLARQLLRAAATTSSGAVVANGTSTPDALAA